MATTATLDTATMREYAKYLQQAPAIAREEMTAAVEEVLNLWEREVKEKTPHGATDVLRGSIAHQLQGSPVEISGKVFSSAAHAAPVELGTRPHWVGREGFLSLRDWVQKKLGVGPGEADGVAMAVAFKISQHGTEGAHMFARTLEEQGAAANEIVARAVTRIVERLNQVPG